MKKYRVYVREVHVQTVEVEADSMEDAIRKVEEDDDVNLVDNTLAYSHLLDADTWWIAEATNCADAIPCSGILKK